jgi:hypothetical protein
MKEPAVCFVVSGHLDIDQHAALKKFGCALEASSTGCGSSSKHGKTKSLLIWLATYSVMDLRILSRFD